MSKKLSLKAALEPRASGKGANRAQSVSRDVRLLLKQTGAISRPVDVVRHLHATGLSLRTSREILERLAQGQLVATAVSSTDPVLLMDVLGQLGVTARVLRVPDASVKDVRDKFHLTQAEFATRFGLELDTVRNWEQGRNKLDPSTRLLLKVI
jgi:DNA-binding XRE family transcriptional regulator